MGIELFIAKKDKPEYFNMFKGFSNIEGISKCKWEAKKLSLTKEELYKNILNASFGDIKDIEIQNYYKKVSDKLYEWIGNDDIWQETDCSFDYCFDIDDNNHFISYKETADRFFNEEIENGN